MDSYRVPEHQARAWVREQAVLPLLDGFDEVDDGRREACAEASNAFVAAHQQQQQPA